MKVPTLFVLGLLTISLVPTAAADGDGKPPGPVPDDVLADACGTASGEYRTAMYGKGWQSNCVDFLCDEAQRQYKQNYRQVGQHVPREVAQELPYVSCHDAICHDIVRTIILQAAFRCEPGIGGGKPGEPCQTTVWTPYGAFGADVDVYHDPNTNEVDVYECAWARTEATGEEFHVWNRGKATDVLNEDCHGHAYGFVETPAGNEYPVVSVECDETS